MSSNQDDYAMTRGIDQSNRLNLQHFLWSRINGFNIHPSISINKPGLRVADVGTGTGIWLVDIHESLPSDAILHGLDVDISMAINHAWAPSRVTFETLDIFQPIPQHLLGQYDVVNVRLFAFVVKNNDPSAIVQKLASMLKPGGYIQWSDADFSSFRAISPPNGPGTSSMEAIAALVGTSPDERLGRRDWLQKLGATFHSHGLGEVDCQKISMDDQLGDRAHWTQFRQMCQLVGSREIIGLIPAENKERFQELIKGAERESLGGSVMVVDWYTWIGKKASE